MSTFHQQSVAAWHFDENREFVASEPGHKIAFTRFAAQPAAHFAKQAVAEEMALRIVDSLEIVEI